MFVSPPRFLQLSVLILFLKRAIPLSLASCFLVFCFRISRTTKKRRMILNANKRRRMHRLRPRFNFDRITDHECKIWFRFTKSDIRRMLPLLRFPDEFRTSWRTKCSSLEALCICLYRLSYPNKWDRCVLLFGRAPSHLSGINTMVLAHMIDNFQHLLKLPEYFTTPARLRYYADALWAKGCRFSNCVGFIDGTLRRMARPKDMQRSVYNGHKKYHGIKFQNIHFPDGLIGEQYGPYEGRRSDPYMMTQSGICGRLETRARFPLTGPDGAANLTLHRPHDLHAPNFFSVDAAGNYTHIQYMIFGDKGYHMQDSGCIMVPYKRYGGYELSEDEMSFNRDMSELRISVEWGFCKVTQLWGYLDNFKQLKGLSVPVGGYYIAATLFTNIHTCLHKNQTSVYFDVEPPSLETYLSW